MRFTLKAILLAVFMTAIGTSQSQAAFYSSSTTFNAANPGLPVITFEGLAPPNGFIVPVPQPIAPGVLFTNPTNGQGSIAVAGPGLFNTPTSVLLVDFFATRLDINLSPSVGAVGFNVANGVNGGSVTVDVFNGVSLLGTTTFNAANQNAFTSYIGIDGFGPITRVAVTPGNGGFILIDNLAYGSAPANAVPAPAGLLLGLTGLPIFGVVARLRRRNVVQA